MSTRVNPEERPIGEVDLAARHLGGTVLAASDESFGEKENLLSPEAPHFEPGHYGNRGELVDGWETRRRRSQPGPDWAIVRLGVPGVLSSIDVDTSFFTGNYPEHCTVDACGVEGYPAASWLQSSANEWVTVVPTAALKGSEHNVFEVSDERRFTHVRLSAHPDGGVARLRVFGRPVPDPRDFDGVSVDLVSERYGGYVVSCSDGFYSSPRHLIRPDEARVMGEGWETRRRRDDGHDFVVFALGVAGRPRQAVIDTSCFRYNASGSVALAGSSDDSPPENDSPAWLRLLPPTDLLPDTRHLIRLGRTQPLRWLRLDAFPDGGLARVRLIGDVEFAARRRAGLRFFNAVPLPQAIRILCDSNTPPETAREIAAARPFDEAEAERLEPLTPILGGDRRVE